jgi:serine kinase of HPr protein (carbohydrate metabolism regulator)
MYWESEKMTVQDIIKQLNLSIVSSANLTHQITGGYASDLLSCVMAGAKAGNVWVTLQAHPNVVAVASLLELSAVIMTEGVSPDSETVSKAQNTSITLLSTPKDTFTIVGELATMGIRGAKPG